MRIVACRAAAQSALWGDKIRLSFLPAPRPKKNLENFRSHELRPSLSGEGAISLLAGTSRDHGYRLQGSLSNQWRRRKGQDTKRCTKAQAESSHTLVPWRDLQVWLVSIQQENTTADQARHRHLLNDIAAMLPHGRKDAKFDSKSNLFQLNELAELYNCNNVLYKSPFRVVSDTMLILASFFEARKGQDLYVWMSKVGATSELFLSQELSHLTDCFR